jgi:lipopolysaccharide export system permease protein
MQILDRYLAGTLIKSALLALFVLLALFAFFSLIDQLEETGRGSYGVADAVQYVALILPRLAVDLFPMASVIGAMATLGLLARNNELTVIRTAGVPQMRLALALVKGGLLLAVLAVVIAEAVAPGAEQAATYRRSLALSDQITLKSRYGFWTRDGRSYINIRKILPGDRFEDIYIYEFDVESRLRSSAHARGARYVDGQWQLIDLRQSRIDGERVVGMSTPLAAWTSLLNPDVIHLVVIKPEHLSLPGLLDYIGYLKRNNQNAMRHEQALWRKITYPFTILALIMLAVPLVRASARPAAVGRLVFIGTLIGVLFHLFQQMMVHLGVVYQLHPALSTVLPVALLLGATILLMRRSA